MGTQYFGRLPRDLSNSRLATPTSLFMPGVLPSFRTVVSPVVPLRMKINILVNGLYVSGASAVVDALSGHPDIAEVQGEFDDFRRHNLVGDLVEQTSERVGFKELKNFILANGGPFLFWGALGPARKDIRGIALLFWFGVNTLRACYWAVVNCWRFASNFRRTNPNHQVARNRKARLTLLRKFDRSTFSGARTQRSRIDSARDWLRKVQEIYSSGETHVLFDQPLMARQHSETWPDVFDPFKRVIVVRNPLDQLSRIFKHKSLSLDHRLCLTGSLSVVFGSRTEDMMSWQILVLQKRLEWVCRELSESDDSELKVIFFEDFILDFDRSVSELLNFLGLNPNFNAKSLIGDRFDPLESRKKIGLDHSFVETLPAGSLDGLRDAWRTLAQRCGSPTREF